MSIQVTVQITYTEPRDSATDSAGNHRRPKRGLIRPQLPSSHLLHGLVHAEVQRRAHRVAHGMQTEAGVQTSKAVALNDLSDRLDGAETGLAAQ